MDKWAALMMAGIAYGLYIWAAIQLQRERNTHADDQARSYADGHADGYVEGYNKAKADMDAHGKRMYDLGRIGGAAQEEREHNMYAGQGGLD